jgi:hypothetical protein
MAQDSRRQARRFLGGSGWQRFKKPSNLPTFADKLHVRLMF